MRRWYWRVEWICPYCERSSERGDWYEDAELSALRAQIESEEWQCPWCGKRAPATAGTVYLWAHGRASGRDPHPERDR